MTFIEEGKSDPTRVICEKCAKHVKHLLQVYSANYYQKWCIACVLDAEE